MNVLDFLDESLFEDDVYIAPHIPESKLKNALEYIAYDLKTSDEILLLIDDTVFGSNKVGIAISQEAIYFKADFIEPLKVEFKNIKDCYVQKAGVVGSKILINNDEIFTTDCASFENVKKVFQAVMDTINDSRSQSIATNKNNINNSDDKVDKVEQSVENKNSDSQQKTKAKEIIVENHPLLRIREPDDLIAFLKSLKVVDAGFGAVAIAADLFANFVFKVDTGFSNKSNKKEIIDTVRGSIINMTLMIRNNVESLGIVELQNNIATMEFVFFSSTLIYREIVDRGYDESIAFEAIRLALFEIFKQDSRYFIGIVKDFCDDIDSHEDAGMCFVARLYFTNFANKTLPCDIFNQINERDIGKALILFVRSQVSADEAVNFNPYEPDIIENVIMLMIQQYGIFDIVGDNVLNEAYRCADKICK